MTDSYYQKLAKDKGLTLIKSHKSKTMDSTWECGNGHVFNASYFNLRRRNGDGCSECLGPIMRWTSQKKTSDDYHQLAKEKGVAFTGTVPKNINALTTWECQNGHKWRLDYFCMSRRVTSCKLCSEILSPEKCLQLAKERGIKVVEMPRFKKEKVTFECDKGHVFSVPYSKLANTTGKGCGLCHGTKRKTIDDYHALAKKRGIKWVSGILPRNTRLKTLWGCDKGHTFEARYTVISSRKESCLECSVNPRVANRARISRGKADFVVPEPSPVPEPQNLPSRWLWAFGRQVDYRMRGWVGC